MASNGFKEGVRWCQEGVRNLSQGVRKVIFGVDLVKNVFRKVSNSVQKV